MKIKITQVTHPEVWYADRIGETFDVTLDSDGDYNVKDWRKYDDGSNPERVGLFVNPRNCVIVPEFSIGSKVIVRDRTLDDGRTGKICGTGSALPWRIRYDSDGETELFHEGDLELVVEQQWLTKEAALKLCIDGAKVVNKNWIYTQDGYVSFDGKNFRYGIDNMIANDVLKWEQGWKLWTPSAHPEPKFTKDSFVIDNDGNYARIKNMEYKDDRWMYELSYRVGGTPCYRCEAQLSGL